MTGRAGVRRLGPVSKRDLLLFDVIYVMGLEAEMARLYDTDQPGAADLEYLAGVGVVNAAPATASELADAIRLELAPELQPLLREMDEAGVEWPTGDGSRRDMLIEAELVASSGQHPASRWCDAPLPRGAEFLVAFLARLQGDDAVAVFDHAPTPTDWRYLSSGVVIPESLRGVNPQARVVEVVLTALPVPADDTPLEAVLDFAADPEVRSEAKALRLWMRRMAGDPCGTRDVEVELETMLHEFRQHLRVHRLKSRDSTLRTVLSIPLGVVEECLHLRPQRAVDAL